MGGTRLADSIERELVQTCLATGLFDVQLPPSRPPVVTSDTAEVEVRFGIIGAPVRPDGSPSAYVSIRERRLSVIANRPVRYWYALIELQPDGSWLYEAFHRHPDATHPEVHFQVEVRSADTSSNEPVATRPAPVMNITTALRELFLRYTGR